MLENFEVKTHFGSRDLIKFTPEGKKEKTKDFLIFVNGWNNNIYDHDNNHLIIAETISENIGVDSYLFGFFSSTNNNLGKFRYKMFTEKGQYSIFLTMLKKICSENVERHFYFISHSFGAYLVLKFLTKEVSSDISKKCKGVFLIAPALSSINKQKWIREDFKELYFGNKKIINSYSKIHTEKFSINQKMIIFRLGNDIKSYKNDASILEKHNPNSIIYDIEDANHGLYPTKPNITKFQLLSKISGIIKLNMI